MTHNFADDGVLCDNFTDPFGRLTYDVGVINLAKQLLLGTSIALRCLREGVHYVGIDILPDTRNKLVFNLCYD
jgi:hypothetical protein